MKTRRKAILILIGVFVLGALAGGAATFAWAQRERREWFAGGRDQAERRRVRALARELDLTDEQERRLSHILRARHQERRRLMDEAMARCGGDLRDHRSRLDAAIRQELTPAQQQRFDELLLEHGLRGFGPPGGPRPRPHGP